MIEAVVSVCGDDEYFAMADISVPSFLRANKDTTLNVFTDQVSRFAPHERLVVHDYTECYERLREERGETLQRMSTLMGKDFDNNGVVHSHAYVALLPLIAEMNVDADWLLKIDVDSYFVGNITRNLGDDYSDHDLWLVSRTRADIMKLFAGVPGVGFTLWRNGGSFLQRYIDEFDGNEQNTILWISGYRAGEKTTDYAGIIDDESFHICYPFYQADVNGYSLEKEDVDEWAPCYIHVRGPEQLQKMQVLDGWYA